MKKAAKKLSRSFSNKAFRSIAVFIFWAAVWKILSLAVSKEILLPSPETTFVHLIRLCMNEQFRISLLYSICRVVFGYFCGLVIGSLFAILSLASGLADALLSPLRAVIKATPVASFIILAYVWMSKNSIPGFTAALIVIPIVWGNITLGFSDVGKKQLEVAKVFGFDRRKKLKYIYIPQLWNYFLAAALTSSGLAWKAGIAAEALVRTKNSIGGMLFESKINFESADLFALTAIVILISVVCEHFIRRCQKHKQ